MLFIHARRAMGDRQMGDSVVEGPLDGCGASVVAGAEAEGSTGGGAVVAGAEAEGSTGGGAVGAPVGAGVGAAVWLSFRVQMSISVWSFSTVKPPSVRQTTRPSLLSAFPSSFDVRTIWKLVCMR